MAEMAFALLRSADDAAVELALVAALAAAVGVTTALVPVLRRAGVTVGGGS